MAKDAEGSAEKSLKLIHLFWTILVVLIMAALAFGEIHRQQKVNTKEIEKKVGTKVYEQHVTHQKEQYDQIIKSLDKIEKKL